MHTYAFYFETWDRDGEYRTLIVGIKPIEDLNDMVQKVVKSMSDAEVVDPYWVQILVSRICDQTGYQIVTIEESADVDWPYWREVRKRRRMNQKEGEDKV